MKSMERKATPTDTAIDVRKTLLESGVGCKLIYPLAPDNPGRTLKSIFGWDEEHLERATIALAALESRDSRPHHVSLTLIGKHALAIEFLVDANMRDSAMLNRAVHRALAAQSQRILPPATIVTVQTTESVRCPARMTAGHVAQLVDAAVTLSRSGTEAEWRQAAATAYWVAQYAATSFTTQSMPAQENLLHDVSEATIWRLRRHGSMTGRALAESMACMSQIHHGATICLEQAFPQCLAVLQTQLMQYLLDDLSAFDREIHSHPVESVH